MFDIISECLKTNFQNNAMSSNIRLLLLGTCYIKVYLDHHVTTYKVGGMVAECLAAPPHSKKVLGSIPTGDTVQKGISLAFRCGVCIDAFAHISLFSPSTKKNHKNMQNCIWW